MRISDDKDSIRECKFTTDGVGPSDRGQKNRVGLSSGDEGRRVGVESFGSGQETHSVRFSDRIGQDRFYSLTTSRRCAIGQCTRKSFSLRDHTDAPCASARSETLVLRVNGVATHGEIGS